MNGIEDADEEENASKGTGRDIEGEQDISMLDVSISETDQPSMKHQAGCVEAYAWHVLLLLLSCCCLLPASCAHRPLAEALCWNGS